ncbi:hypothetical protein [Mycolicibacterium iranicum]|uniref:Uncharacterized protein n=1 Tax=Mycolicibacterium iranicum TaxID=912594 RepID=A0A1X1WSG9_MYCIR|nr:hypothetical protein [Mycolicibacterium iranicum]ORV89483.1 hypothetical protein AWC12_08610 [Mycolicibacterium iranicum]
MNEPSPLTLDRLHTVLQRATGLDGKYLAGSVNATSSQVYQPSTSVKFPTGSVASVERVNLWLEDADVRLAVWPAELKSQFTSVYSDPGKVQRLIAAEDASRWEIFPNFQLAFPFSAPAMRWYPRRHLTGAQYLNQWIDDLRDDRARGCRREDVERNEFWDWLLERRYADRDDRQSFDMWLSRQPVRRQIHIRPGFEILRLWSLDEVGASDMSGRFASEVRECLDEILAALGEPSLLTFTANHFEMESDPNCASPPPPSQSDQPNGS